MRKAQPKTNAQVRRMFGLAKPLADASGCEAKEYIEEVIYTGVVGNPAISELTFDEANSVIKKLGGEPFSPRGNSIRMQNYRKQQAGIKTIETPAQLNFIDELARLRGMSPEGLERLATRMRLPWPPQTTEQGNKIVEALKAMNKRDGQSSESKVQSPKPAAEPKFRRVA